MTHLPSRAVLVWTATDPDKSTEHAKALVDYVDRAQLDVVAFAAMPEALQMLIDGLCDAVVIATGRDAMAAGIHIASAMEGRPMPVRQSASDPDGLPITQRRAQIIGGAR